MSSLNDFLENELQELNNLHRMRQLKRLEHATPPYIRIDGKKILSFGENDYFGLSQHSQVLSAAIEATKTFGTSARSSRLVTGNHSLYHSLESQLASYYKAQKALIFSSGYVTNQSVISSIMKKGDLIIADKLCHHSMISGAQYSGAKVIRYLHNNIKSLHQIIDKYRKKYNKCIIITESVFSMDGDQAPLQDIVNIAHQNDTIVLCDHAHALEVTDIFADIDIHVGTLSKSLGSVGGFVAGSSKLTDYLCNRAGGVIYSTGLPPSALAAANAALKILTNNINLKKEITDKYRFLSEKLSVPFQNSAIVPIIVGSEDKALAASHALLDCGIYVPAIRPPTVPPGTSRLRVSISTLHTDDHLRELVKNLKNVISLP